MRPFAAWLVLSLGAIGSLPAAEPALTPLDARAQVLALADARRFDGERIATLARHPDAGVRVALGRAAGELANPAGVPVLFALARDPDSAVRAAAAQGAGRLAAILPVTSHERGVLGVLLRRLLEDPISEVRAAAAWGVGMAGLPEGDLWLLHRLTRERAAAVEASILQELWRSPGSLWIKRATPFVSRPDARVRFAAVWSLARSGKQEAVGGLRRAATDADPLVRAAALGGAHRGKASSLWAELCAGAADPDARVRVAAFDGLTVALTQEPARKLAPELVQRLVDCIAGTSPERVHERIAAVRLAGAAGCCAEALETAMGAKEPWVSGEALVALAQGRGKRAAALVRSWLGEAEVERRLTAVRALRLLALMDAELAAPLADPSTAVRLAAIEAYGSALGPAAVAALGKRLADDDPAVRAAAVSALADANALPPAADLERLLTRERGANSPAAAVALVEALAKGRALTPEVRSALEPLLAGGDPVVARAAWAALARHGVVRPLPEVTTGEEMAFYRRVIDWAAKPRWLEVVTWRGTLQLSLDTAAAPLACYRMSGLAEKKFFDGLTFHRVVPNFVVQGGDPRGDGWGGPGFVMRDELSLALFDAGAVGVALSGPDTGGSQLFLTLTLQPRLDGRYTFLGKVAAGIEVAQRLRVGDRILRIRAGEGALPPFFPVWYGPLKAERLDAGISGWREEREKYRPDSRWLNLLRGARLRYGLAVAMGTWCGDSREQIPRLEAILSALGPASPFEELLLVGIDRSKAVDTKLFPFGKVELVPTIVVTAGASEVGRIVETPTSGSIEEDLARILASIEAWDVPEPGPTATPAS